MAFRGEGSDRPWSQVLPAAWSLDLRDRQPLPCIQVDPTVGYARLC
jgi:hypothetical protein